MFTYAELISLQSAMTDKITRSKRILNEATHLDTIDGMREILEGCLNDDIQALQQANKEIKTISGTITIIRALWSKGYKQAFSEFGLSFADMEFKTL